MMHGQTKIKLSPLSLLVWSVLYLVFTVAGIAQCV